MGILSAKTSTVKLPSVVSKTANFDIVKIPQSVEVNVQLADQIMRRTDRVKQWTMDCGNTGMFELK